MATQKKAATAAKTRRKKAAEPNTAEITDSGQGYAGTKDYTDGKFTSSDPEQASTDRIREDRKNHV